MCIHYYTISYNLIKIRCTCVIAMYIYESYTAYTDTCGNHTTWTVIDAHVAFN